MRPNVIVARLMLVVLLAGCTSPAYQAAPELKGHGGIRKIGIIIDARVDYMSSIFGREDRDARKGAELTAAAAKNMEGDLVRRFAAEGYSAVVLPLDEDARALVARYEASRSGPTGQAGTALSSGPGRGAASLAPLPELAAYAEKAGVDGIVIVRASNGADSTKAKIEIGMVVVILVASMAALGAIPGAIGPSYNADFAVLGRDGQMLFRERNYIDLGDTQDVSKAVARFVGDLAVSRKQ